MMVAWYSHTCALPLKACVTSIAKAVLTLGRDPKFSSTSTSVALWYLISEVVVLKGNSTSTESNPNKEEVDDKVGSLLLKRRNASPAAFFEIPKQIKAFQQGVS